MISNESDKLLLLDLDGVLVTEGNDGKINSELITIHQQLLDQLKSLKFPVAVLTHRSRCEALQIIQVLGLNISDFLDIFTANDILHYGLRFKGISYLVKHGSKKSVILLYILKRYNIAASNVAFIDDRLSNIEGLMDEGLGLGIKVPEAKLINGKQIVSFHLDQALEKVKVWAGEVSLSDHSSIINIPSVTIDLPAKAFSGYIITRKWTDIFGIGRSGLRFSRQHILKVLNW